MEAVEIEGLGDEIVDVTGPIMLLEKPDGRLFLIYTNPGAEGRCWPTTYHHWMRLKGYYDPDSVIDDIQY